MKVPGLTQINATMAKILDQVSSTTLLAVRQGTYEVSLAANIRIYEREQGVKYEQSCTDDEKDLCVERWEMGHKCSLGVNEQVCW